MKRCYNCGELPDVDNRDLDASGLLSALVDGKHRPFCHACYMARIPKRREPTPEEREAATRKNWEAIRDYRAAKRAAMTEQERYLADHPEHYL